MPDKTITDDDDSLDLLINATAESPAPAKKVELDLDDAPFLQTEEKNLPAPSHEAAVPEAPVDEAELARKRKRKLIIVGAILAVVLLIAAAAVWWFFFRGEGTTPAGPEPEVIVVPSAPKDDGKAEIVREFEPFVIPVRDAAGNVGFLICKFSAIASDASVNDEIDTQRTALRDAIYFYLRGKDSAWLMDARNGEAIKSDLLSVFNDYLTRGKLEDILFESYLSR